MDRPDLQDVLGVYVVPVRRLASKAVESPGVMNPRRRRHTVQHDANARVVVLLNVVAEDHIPVPAPHPCIVVDSFSPTAGADVPHCPSAGCSVRQE